jgi:3-hydroxyisobutyrate dehydrogenase-like beta-hydroxyacid dehydrogenase
MRIAPGQTRIGWIGLGVMGAPMCGHLLDAGFSASVFTRTRAKAEPLVARGARWADTPRAVAEASDVIFTMVGFPQDVRAVILGAVILGEQGALAGCKPGAVIVDMTSSEPALAAEIAEAARTRGVHSVDAPVSGGDVGAREARLSIMIGGEPDVVEALQPCFAALGRTIVHHGDAGAGQHAKVVNQTLVAGCMVGVCEALLYAHRAARHRGEFRARFLRRSLREGHGHRAGRGAAHGHRAARTRAGASALRGPASSWTRSRGNSGAGPGTGVALGRRVAPRQRRRATGFVRCVRGSRAVHSLSRKRARRHGEPPARRVRL